MANRIRSESESKKHDAHLIASQWLERGISPIPIKPFTKRPKMGERWNDYRATPETIPRDFQRSDSVGGLWGLASNWIVDVDLDWDEAARAARRILPKTFTYGRPSRPNTHYLVQSVNCRGLKRVADDGSVIVEIRSTGSQSVLPPSIHPDNERFTIYDDAPFAEIGPVQLERYINRIAAAALFARYYPEGGGRHDFICAIVGGLMRDGWEPDQCNDFCLAVLDATEHEDDRQQRERTIANTIQHYVKGDKVYGWPTLTNWLKSEVIEKIKDWLRPEKRVLRVQNEKAPTDISRLEITGKAIPSDLLNVDGLVAEVAKWAARRSYLKQPAFDLAVGIMATALASGNRYIVDAWDTPLQPYFMLLAPTAGGKEVALNSVATFARRIELGGSIAQGFQSHHAMLDKLCAPPNIACWLWDEAGRKLRSALRSPSSPEYQVITWLLSLYGKSATFSPAMPGRKQGIPEVDKPFMVTLAASQPELLVEAISSADISAGLINRFLLIDPGEELPDDNFEREDIFPAALLEFSSRFKRVGSAEDFIRIPFGSTAVYSSFQAFQSESRRRAAMEGINEFWGRANQNALILAGIRAVGLNPEKPVINDRIATWAIEFSRWSCARWMLRISDQQTRSKLESVSKAIERQINSPLRYSSRASDKMRVLMSDGYMPRSMLTRLNRNLSKRELSDVLDSLLDAELIQTGERGGHEVYFRK